MIFQHHVLQLGFLALLGAVVSSSVAQDANDASSDLLDFEQWSSLHEKSYPSAKEIDLRRAIFEANAGIVHRHNQAFQQGWTSYAMTLASPFADLTADEFASIYLMDGQNCSATHRSSGSLFHGEVQDLPTFVDWRTKGIVTPIKNQKRCGSCWTFSTTGTLEAHTCLHNAQPAGVDCTKWTGLAEQQLLDCASAYDNHGCNGGLPSHAYEYIKAAGGLDLEESYHYRADSDGPCVMSEGVVGAHVAEVYNITSFDEDDLVAAIAQVGPVSIAYQVSPDFRFYSHGVYDSFNATTNQTMCQSGPMDVNHAVVAVGYGETEATDHVPSIPFYIVRNSWSTSFGMEGYFWMERGKNLCGVSDCASFPIIPAAAKKDQLESPQRLRLASSNHIVSEKME
jgi:cathepsin H